MPTLPVLKTCDRCEELYQGFGPTCSNCRSSKSTPAQRCSVCGSCFLGFRGKCSDCNHIGSEQARIRSRTDSPKADRASQPKMLYSKSDALPSRHHEQEDLRPSPTLATLDSGPQEQAAFREYFNAIQIFWKKHCGEVKELWSQSVVDIEIATAISQQLEKRTVELHESLRPLIEQAFTQHDVNKDGFLDREETHTFLSDYGHWQVLTCEYIVAYGAELALMRQAPGRPVDEEHLQKMRDAMISALRDQHEAYLESARDHHMKVARLLDDGGADCQIGREKVVLALLPGTKQNRKFVQRLPTLLAHGFLPAWSALELRPQGKTLAAIAATLV